MSAGADTFNAGSWRLPPTLPVGSGAGKWRRRAVIEQRSAGTVKIVGFRGKLGLSKRRNLLRYSPTWKDPYFTDGAAHGRSLGGKAERNHLVSQPLAGTRAGVREKPRSLEGEVQDVVGAAQGFPHRSAGSASFARSVASQGGGPGTGNQPTACPVAAASRFFRFKVRGLGFLSVLS